MREKQLKKIFQEAVRIQLLEAKDKRYVNTWNVESLGCSELIKTLVNILHRSAFVEFATVEDSVKALQSSKNIKICKTVAKVDFSHSKAKPGSARGIFHCNRYF